MATWRGESILTDNFIQKGYAQGEQYIDSSLKRVLIIYASVQAARGTLAIIQHSSLSLQPAGVGAVVATGRIVEPVSDILAKVSDVLFVSAASLGVQKVLLTISNHWLVWAFLVFATALFAIVIFLPNNSAFVVQAKRIVAAVCFCAVLLRLFMVIFLLFSSSFFAVFLQEDASKRTDTLGASMTEIQISETLTKQEKKSTLRSFFTKRIQPILTNISKRAEVLMRSAQDLISTLIIELIAMPLLFIGCVWLAWRVVRAVLPADYMGNTSSC